MGDRKDLLPDDVLTLVNCTLELIELLYWTPVSSTGSLEGPMVTEVMASKTEELHVLIQQDGVW